ncbi:dipeptide ABC transporter ATP-binding protein [Leucobacter chromiiresistens]|uniref:Peptide/nickel transport system ATP-binding protein n=1 Tax=Leucobacter chromiiresistens TaxID=1079994 RepID=A0A1H0XWQ0_9MICO|nr:ABC transporter ATP-binding protein [Leucobacter chromiiresistens]SDQ07251.1 peptide/nickel transport system ATP-binding protein [Leucobacter chromiiresistens]
MTAAPLLSIRDLAVQYRTRRGTVDAVRGVGFDVRAGEVTAVVGESGSGKTTVAQSVIGLLPSNGRVTAGSVTLNERRLGTTELVGLPERRWRDLRGRCIGLIPQDPGNSLNPVQPVGKSISESLRIHGRPSRDEVRDRVHALLEQVGIDQPVKRARQYPHEFSGGMRQRVLIAAALANDPELIIADEPTSALDVTVQRTVLDLIDRLREETGTGVLFITHDLAVAADRADSVVVMRGGEVQESGPAAQVLANPASAYTKQLMADAPSFGRLVDRETVVLAAEPASATAEPGSATAGPASAAALVEVRDLRQVFGRGSDAFVAVDGVSFAVAPGTTHALVGESGSGKTTTGRAIAGFAAPTSGSVRVAGTEVTELRGGALRQFRRTTQMVYQNPYGSLDPRLSVGQTLAEPLANYRIGTGSRADRAERVAHALEVVSLPAEFSQRRPRELSGGQRQRVAIARALIVEPELVVLDEAVSALDVTVQAQILRLLARLQQELGLTYVFISHDLAVVRQISDTVTVLQRGRQVEHGATEDVFSNAQDPYTQRLIEAIPGASLTSGHWEI